MEQGPDLCACVSGGQIQPLPCSPNPVAAFPHRRLQAGSFKPSESNKEAAYGWNAFNMKLYLVVSVSFCPNISPSLSWAGEGAQESCGPETSRETSSHLLGQETAGLVIELMFPPSLPPWSGLQAAGRAS